MGKILKQAIILVLSTLSLAASLAACGIKNDVGSLQKIQTDIEKTFPDIAHISAEDLQTQLTKGDASLLILDTRPIAEYEVSHIKGAMQVDPDISPEAFKARFENVATDISVIVYCSVGWRSSIAANRLTSSLKAAGVSNIANLEGGLFGWHNEGRALINATGPTKFIHPYNEKWGVLVTDKEMRSYTVK